MLGNLLIQERLLEAGGISENDLRDYYEAHRERYRLPEVVCYSFAPVGSDGKTPGVFTKVTELHARGEPFAGGRGVSAEADAALFALEEGGITAKPVVVAGTPLFFRLDEKQAAKTLPYEGVKSRVQQELSTRRRIDAVSRLRAEVSKRHPVEILDPALREAMTKTGDRPVK